MKVSTAVSQIINENSFVHFGLEEGLFNLSKLAHFLQPVISARTAKSVSHSAILMQLSRLKKLKESTDRENTSEFEESIKLTKLTIHSNLSTLTVSNSTHNRQSVLNLQRKFVGTDHFFSSTKGAFQTTMIFSDILFDEIVNNIAELPIHHTRNISCLVASFDPKDIHYRGLIYKILQKIYFQNINLVEVASTATELSIFLENQDIKIAFDTLYHSFVLAN